MKTYPLLTTLVLGLAGSSFARNQGPAPTHANVAYDTHERTVLDFWQAEGEGPRPLLVYIHGGGWIKGDKRAMRNSMVYLDQGISVASVNYRLLGKGVTLPSPVHDAARAVQFLRSKAREWNIDKNKIVLSGRSAGACSSLWIACHDDLAKPGSNDPVERESTRVLGAGVEVGQTSIDPVVIEPWIGPNVYHPMIYKAVGEDSAEAMHKNYARHKELYREFSAISHLSEDDPLLFLEYDSKFDMSVPAKSINHGIHHPVFGVKFKEKSANVGHHKVELMIVNHEESDRYSSIEDFAIKTLVGGVSAPAEEVQSVDNQPSTVIPVPSKLKKFMPSRHNAKLEQAKTSQVDLVMIGDSITHNWERMDNYESTFEGRNLLNLGFAGDRTQNVLWRLQHGAVDGISPRLVTLLIGTNHLHHPKKGYTPDTPEDVFTGIQAVVAELRTRLPESKILVFSVFPRKPGEENDRVTALNKVLPRIADGRHVFHVDINRAFLDDRGNYIPALYNRDGLHLSAAGYAAWAKALQPVLAEAGLDAAEGEAAVPAAKAGKDAAAVTDAPVLRLWPIEMVGGESNRLKEEYSENRGRKRLSAVLDPNLTVYPAQSDTPAPAVVYCPGGAYRILGLPSPEVIKQWNDLGITLFVLKYTIPEDLEAAFKDVQRAVRLVRHQARKWNIDPDRIGLFGNSAGGHLASRLTQNYDQVVYEPIDDADKVSCEPNFAVLQCAAYYHGRPLGTELDTRLFHMNNKVAPTFLTYSKDDQFSAGGVDYAEALKAAGGHIHLKLFEKGGHGMRGCDWFPPAAQWLKANKFTK